MCGIFGFSFEDIELLQKMESILIHRGPDAKGNFTDESMSLGHCRLKIIDLSNRAKQPMSNEDESIWLVYNGEIYNFKALREKLEQKKHEFKSETDSEVIIHGYEEWGINVLKRLRGIFAFALYDSDKKTLFLARDRIGVKPLYYSIQHGEIIFASEIKAILQHMKPELNEQALDQFFTFQYTIAPQTLFKKIWKLKPGHYMKYCIKTKKSETKKYWDLKSQIKYLTEKYFITKIEEKIKESVKIRLISDVPIGIYLSGGLDSSYIAAVAKELKQDIKAYTVSFSEDDESEFASDVASYLDIDHKIIPCKLQSLELLPKVTWHLDKPSVNIAALPLYAMAQESKKYLTVALMGDGGDETFAGYEKYRLIMLRQKLNAVPDLFTTSITSILPLKKEVKNRLKIFLSKDYVKVYLSYISSFTDEERQNLLKIRVTDQDTALKPYFNQNPVQSAFLFDIKTLLPDDYLMKVDKTTMANAVEARVPYLDHQLVELALSIPPEYKLKRLKTKAFFRKVIKKKLPDKIVERKKHGFNVPTQQWLSSGLKEIALQLIDVAPSIISKNYAFEIINKFKQNPRYYSRQFWSIITFIIWYKMYFEMDAPDFNINSYVS